MPTRTATAVVSSSTSRRGRTQSGASSPTSGAKDSSPRRCRRWAEVDAPRVLVCTQGFPRHPDDHGTDAAIARGPLRPLAGAVLRRATTVLAASNQLAGWVRDIAGVDAVVAPMPLGADRVPAPTLPPAGGPVLAVGRLVPEKGF